MSCHFFLFLLICYITYFYFTAGQIYPTQKFKYPPQSYYLSYAMFMSSFLFFVTNYTNFFNKIIDNALIKAIGSSTLWIYLWQWYFVKIFSVFFPDATWVAKALTIYVLTVLIVIAQVKCVNFICIRFNFAKKRQHLLRKIFTG